MNIEEFLTDKADMLDLSLVLRLHNTQRNLQIIKNEKTELIGF